MAKSARQTAFELLLRIEKEGAYSNLLLDETLGKTSLDTRDKAFVSALAYGTVERKLTIDYQLCQYLSKPLKKLRPEVLVILRMGAYQIFYMDKVPDSAAVNESVKLSRNNKCSFASSLVNAVLRKCALNGLVFPKETDAENHLSVKYSCPKWLIHKWLKEYGKEDTTEILKSSNGKIETVIRVNTLKTDSKKLQTMLQNEGVTCKDGYIENSLIISLEGRDVASLDSFKDGLFHVQDTASQLCAKAVCAEEGDTVFDLCSAPGGKTFTISQQMNDKGKIFAFDLYQQRVNLIAEGAHRLGIEIVNARKGDAAVFDESLGLADKVLCDVPCSGLGIIRRKPEIKYKEKESLEELPKIQLEILKNGSKYVKKGGRLVYSTCTLSKAENEDVCEAFLSGNKSFVAVRPLPEVSDDNFVTLMPHKNGSDGFFIAAFEKKEN